MDLQEKHKLDSERLAGQLAQVKARTRPWRSIIALLPITAVAFGVFAAGATVGLGGEAWAVPQPRAGSAHAAVVRYSLLLSRPFHVGQPIRVRSGALGGVLDGTVTEIGLTYVHLDTGEGVLALPNAQVLAAAVGPLPAEVPGRPGYPA
jgi:hypothetical protein